MFNDEIERITEIEFRFRDGSADRGYGCHLELQVGEVIPVTEIRGRQNDPPEGEYKIVSKGKSLQVNAGAVVEGVHQDQLITRYRADKVE